jgi:hypothetical protein
MHGDPPLSAPHSLQVFTASLSSSWFPISPYLKCYSFGVNIRNYFIIFDYLLIGHVQKSARNAQSAGSQLRSGCQSLMYKPSFLTLIGAKQEKHKGGKKKKKNRVVVF